MYRVHEFRFVGFFPVHSIHGKTLIRAQGCLSWVLFCFVSQMDSVILSPCSQMQLGSVSGMGTVMYHLFSPYRMLEPPSSALGEYLTD